MHRQNIIGSCKLKCHWWDIRRRSSSTGRSNYKQSPFMWNEKRRGGDLREFLQQWQKSGFSANQFREHIYIVKVLKPDTSLWQNECKIHMNATVRRFQCSVDMVFLVGLVDLNRVVLVRVSPTDRTKKAKVPISELILRQITTDNKPIFLYATKK